MCMIIRLVFHEKKLNFKKKILLVFCTFGDILKIFNGDMIVKRGTSKILIWLLLQQSIASGICIALLPPIGNSGK